MTTDTEKRYVWYAQSYYRFIIERYELIRKTKTHVVVRGHAREITLPRGRVYGHGRVFFAEAKARDHLRAIVLRRADQAKAEAANWQSMADGGFEVVDICPNPTGSQGSN